MELYIDCSELPYDILMALPGVQDENFKMIEKEFPVRLSLKDGQIRLDGTESACIQVHQVLDTMVQTIDRSGQIDAGEVQRLCLVVKSGNKAHVETDEEMPVVRTRNGKMIFPKTQNQKKLVDAFRKDKIIFASGVAGTGKTYLAVAYAVDQLKKEKISKIILTRPAVEAGESLGFLPGDMKEKVDPYLRPLYDALNEMLGQDTAERFQEKEIIEIAPLAFMRGRTLNDAVVILDEAQNTTRAQMKMFLTRMGRNCQMIVNGDISQTDLVSHRDSGLTDACNRLKGIEGISIQPLDKSDVVRNPLVAKMIERYEEAEQ